ncbi:MAG: transposase [Acholeplasmataceae bacterium]|nr:transposase [Acholeplasmataceae bacterium]
MKGWNLDKKGKKSHYGFKLHTIVDKENQLIRRFATSTASLNDTLIPEYT